MVQQTAEVLRNLYEADETAWLETMADLIKQGRLDDLDYAHLSEYLLDMARRDRREVKSRLTTLLTHILKWTHQTEKRSKSWIRTIVVQRQELADDLSGGVLRKHAEEILPAVYLNAVERAAVETGLPATAFPAECPL